MPTKNCKHEKTLLWKLDRSMQRLVNFAIKNFAIKKAGLNMNIKNLKQLRGYLLTCCLNCDKIVNMEVIAMPDDTYNPFNRRVQNAAIRTRAFELFGKGCESWQVSNRLGINNRLAIRWHTAWRKTQGLTGRKPRAVEL